MSVISNANHETLLVDKIIDAPVGVVWGAWTTGDNLAQWWKVKILQRTVVVEYDFQVGGIWRQYGVDMDGNEVGVNNAGSVFTEIIPQEKIVTKPAPTDDEVVEIVPDSVYAVIRFESLNENQTRVGWYMARSKKDDWAPSELAGGVWVEILDNLALWAESHAQLK